MTIAGNINAMAALLAANNFSTANFQTSLGMTPAQPAPANYVELAPQQVELAQTEEKIQPGQMKSETPENTTDALANNNGLDSIRAGLENKAKEFENTALALSDQGAELAKSELTADSKFTPDSSTGLRRHVDNLINNVIFGADKSGQGVETSLADLGDMPVDTKGIQQRTRDAGMGTPA